MATQSEPLPADHAETQTEAAAGPSDHVETQTEAAAGPSDHAGTQTEPGQADHTGGCRLTQQRPVCQHNDIGCKATRHVCTVTHAVASRCRNTKHLCPATCT
jgi:hypothetical protein